MATRSSVFVGIDISLGSLDVAICGNSSFQSFLNTPKGITQLIAFLQGLSPTLVVVVATGGYEKALVQALHSASLPVSVVLPKQIREFARAQGVSAKTDNLDARNIAQFASSLQPHPNAPSSSDQIRLSTLVDRRRQIVLMIKAEKNRRSKAPVELHSSFDEHLEWLIDEEKRLNAEIYALIQNQPDMKRKSDIVPRRESVQSPPLIWSRNCPN